MKIKLSVNIIFLLLCSTCIYSQNLKPSESEVLLNVSVTDFSGTPRKSEIIYFISTKKHTVFSGVTDNKGNFLLLLPKNDVYRIKYRNFNDSLSYKDMEVPADKGLYEFSVQIQIEPPKVYVLEDVLFDFGKANLRKESYKTLNNLVEVLNIKKDMIIEIAGHTDNIGNSKENLILSQKRAEAVKNYLIQKGISSNRLIAKGYGDTQPVADNNSAEGQQKNRRTEIRIISE